VSPTGAPVSVGLSGERAVVLFLTSSCYGCRAIWDGFAARAQEAGPPEGVAPSSSPTPGKPDNAIVVLVTPSPSTESARRVAALAPGGVEIVMSSEAWHAYGVTAAPSYVAVAGGRVVAQGAAPARWAEVEVLLRGDR
jgi:hypothetical protein